MLMILDVNLINNVLHKKIEHDKIQAQKGGVGHA